MQARCEILLTQNSIIDVFAKANGLVLTDKGLKYRRRRSGVQRRNGALWRGSTESPVFAKAKMATKKYKTGMAFDEKDGF